MVIRVMPRVDRSGRRDVGLGHLESHPSGLNRTDARRLTRREIEHRERMLAHLHRVSVTHLALDRADDAV